MQGHHVMDNVVMKLLIPVCTVLRREREQEIKRLGHRYGRIPEIGFGKGRFQDGQPH